MMGERLKRPDDFMNKVTELNQLYDSDREEHAQMIGKLMQWIEQEKRGEEIDLDRALMFTPIDYSLDNLEELVAHNFTYIKAKTERAA